MTRNPEAPPRSPSPAKAYIRATLISARRGIPPQERADAAVAVAERLAGWDRWTGARHIGVYRPMGAEVAPPIPHGASFPVLDPAGFTPLPVSRLDLILMPVVGVSLDGVRLGRGGGWYDRLLGALRDRPLLVALAYDLQVLDTIPHDPWDVPVDAICTPTRLVMTCPSSTGS